MPSDLISILLLAAFVIGFFGLNAYLGWRIATLWVRGRLGRWVLGLVLLFLSLAYPTVRVMAYEDGWPFVQSLAEVWMGLSVFLLCWFMIAEIVWFFAKRTGRGTEQVRQVAFGMAVFMGALTGLAGYYNAQLLNEVNYRLRVEKSAGVKNLRVAVVSDLHLGKGKPAQWLAKVVARVEAWQPDIILLAGDIVDFNAADFERGGYAEIFRRLKAPLGVYAVRGNHDFFDADTARLTAAFREAGIVLMDDAVVELPGGIYLAGRKDRSQPRAKLPEILKGIDPEKPLLLMDHRPDRIEESQAAGVDVQFSGHTHGGQFFPATVITKFIYPIDHGVLQEGPFTLVVTSGAGLWGPPYRLGSQSEIVLVDVEFGPPALPPAEKALGGF